MLGLQVKQADIFTEDTLFSFVVLLGAPFFYFYIHPGSAGTVYKREIWPTWDRETAATQNQDFAKLLKNRKRWGTLWSTKKSIIWRGFIVWRIGHDSIFFDRSRSSRTSSLVGPLSTAMMPKEKKEKLQSSRNGWASYWSTERIRN